MHRSPIYSILRVSKEHHRQTPLQCSLDLDHSNTFPGNTFSTNTCVMQHIIHSPQIITKRRFAQLNIRY